MLWFKVGDIAHIKSNMRLCNELFYFNSGFKIIEVNSKRESYLCQIPVKGKIREIELSQSNFVSPSAWTKTKELDNKFKEIGLS